MENGLWFLDRRWRGELPQERQNRPLPENRMPTKVNFGANGQIFAALNWKKLYLNMEKSDWKTVAKRFGVAGFLFFLVKGLVWLAVFFGAGKLLCS